MERALRFVLAALTAHWAWFALTASVTVWSLVLGGLAALAVAWRWPETPRHGDPAPRWLVAAVLVILAMVTAILAYGSLATPSRQWDGVVAWDLRADYLGAEGGLAHAFFNDPAVLSHSRDYPLLQPTLVHWFGRGVFPVFYLLLAALVGNALRRRGVGSSLSWLAALALALTPALISPGGGSVDSGYGEVLLAVCTTASGAGILVRDRGLLAMGIVLAIGTKPEGLVYGALPVLLGWCCADSWLLRTGLSGWAFGALCWLPLQLALQNCDATGVLAYTPVVAVAVAAVAALLLGSHVLLERRGVRAKWRWILALVAGPLIVLALPLVLLAFAEREGTLDVYARDLSSAVDRLVQIPSVVASFLKYAVEKCGVSFVLPLLALAALWRPNWRREDTRLGQFLILGLVTAMLPFFAVDIPVDEHLRSRMPRLLLHWLGSAWLLGTVAAHVITDGRPDERS